jgi:succinate-semialdehyde dehydrogenase/glutarate-semialdehyde dehydrogenase
MKLLISGPLATVSIVSEIAAQVEKTVAMGGKVLVGGQRLEGKGNFYLPTILTDIPVWFSGKKRNFLDRWLYYFESKISRKRFALANDSPFGLGSSAWTNNPEEIERLITEIEAGCVFINGMVKSDSSFTLWGIKRSGFGRELSVEGIREFVNVKTIWIK